MKITASPGHILVKLINEDSSGGIYMPENDRRKPSKAEVIDVGAPLKDQAVVCNTGDTVIIRQWAGTEYEEGSGKNKETFYFMRYDDIVGVIK